MWAYEVRPYWLAFARAPEPANGSRHYAARHYAARYATHHHPHFPPLSTTARCQFTLNTQSTFARGISRFSPAVIDIRDPAIGRLARPESQRQPITHDKASEKHRPFSALELTCGHVSGQETGRMRRQRLPRLSNLQIRRRSRLGRHLHQVGLQINPYSYTFRSLVLTLAPSYE